MTFTSNLLNWYFAKLSTNSNVNGYEVDNLPIKIAELEKRTEIIHMVEALLRNPDDSSAKDILNAAVYAVYGLSEKQIEIVERHYQ